MAVFSPRCSGVGSHPVSSLLRCALPVSYVCLSCAFCGVPLVFSRCSVGPLALSPLDTASLSDPHSVVPRRLFAIPCSRFACVSFSCLTGGSPLLLLQFLAFALLSCLALLLFFSVQCLLHCSLSSQRPCYPLSPRLLLLFLVFFLVSLPCSPPPLWLSISLLSCCSPRFSLPCMPALHTDLASFP